MITHRPFWRIRLQYLYQEAHELLYATETEARHQWGLQKEVLSAVSGSRGVLVLEECVKSEQTRTDVFIAREFFYKEPQDNLGRPLMARPATGDEPKPGLPYDDLVGSSAY